ncbi:MAG: hypothetical protein KDC98_09445 [Planctomycetes bacterium]|nr:hypothetical protein [Planctomycetota bacterium]
MLSLAPSPLRGQAVWHLARTSGPAPAIAYHGGAYDPLRQRLVLCGGFDQTYTAQDATWEFDGATWIRATPTVVPPARGAHAIAFDAVRGRAVMFGGTPSVLGGSAFDDTWDYDGITWTQRQPANHPSARFDHAMAFDLPATTTILFGGRTPGSQSNALGDTWQWDGVDWTLVTSAGPAARSRHAMASDYIRGRTVLFGGRGRNQFADTWEWDGVSWHQLNPTTSPPVRSGHAIAFDPVRGLCVLHGGGVSGTDTWEWDGTDWTQGASTAFGHSSHTLVYDDRLQRITMHGGVDVQSTSFRSETDTYSPPVAGSFTSLGSSCPGSTSTPTLSSPSSTLGPTIGASCTLLVTASFVHTFFAFGWSDSLDGNTPLPLDLSAYGMPGCTLQVSRDAITSVIPQYGTARVLVPIPDNPFLIGARFFAQGFALDPSANAGGFTTTNRLQASIGRL